MSSPLNGRSVPHNPTPSGINPLLLVSLGAFLVSFAAVFVKMLQGGPLGPTVIGFWRAFFGAAILFAFALVRRERLTMPWPIVGWTALAGFVFYLDLFFWHRSILYAGAGMATILANTQVLITAVLSYFVFRERLSLRFFAAAFAAVLGVALLIGIGSDFEFTSLYLEGIVYGLLTSVVYASYLIIMKKSGHCDNHPGFLIVMSWTSLFTACYLAISSIIEGGQFFPSDAYSWLTLFGLGLVVQTGGWWVIITALPRLRASRSGLALLLQPVMATVWGVLFFAEHLTLLQIIGAIVTLAAIYAGSIRSGAEAPPTANAER